MPPSDGMVWRRLVAEMVDRLSALGVRWFEVWNEPDFPVFFQGSPTEFFEEDLPAVGRSRARGRTPNGTAASLRWMRVFVPNPVWIVRMMRFAREHSLPLDFISWHYYGNTPFLGPDRAEPLAPLRSVPLSCRSSNAIQCRRRRSTAIR